MYDIIPEGLEKIRLIVMVCFRAVPRGESKERDEEVSAGFWIFAPIKHENNNKKPLKMPFFQGSSGRQS